MVPHGYGILSWHLFALTPVTIVSSIDFVIVWVRSVLAHILGFLSQNTPGFFMTRIVSLLFCVGLVCLYVALQARLLQHLGRI